VGEIELFKAGKDDRFLCSVQAAIWRTDWLRANLDYDWNPWEFEKHAGRDGGLVLGVGKPLLEYVNAVGGQGHKPGEFDREKIPEKLWQELQELHLV
jgi:hypothetical protein